MLVKSHDTVQIEQLHSVCKKNLHTAIWWTRGAWGCILVQNIYIYISICLSPFARLYMYIHTHMTSVCIGLLSVVVPSVFLTWMLGRLIVAHRNAWGVGTLNEMGEGWGGCALGVARASFAGARPCKMNECTRKSGVSHVLVYEFCLGRTPLCVCVHASVRLCAGVRAGGRAGGRAGVWASGRAGLQQCACPWACARARKSVRAWVGCGCMSLSLCACLFVCLCVSRCAAAVFRGSSYQDHE